MGGIATGVDYAASKAGVVGVTRTLARQYGRHGIRVNAVAPGPIATEMTRHWSTDLRESFIARIPLGRLGTVEDVARVVAFLAGPDCFLRDRRDDRRQRRQLYGVTRVRGRHDQAVTNALGWGSRENDQAAAGGTWARSVGRRVEVVRVPLMTQDCGQSLLSFSARAQV